MNWTIVVALGGSVLSAITVVASAWIGRHSGRAAVKQAASADWQGYTAELRQRLSKVEERLDNAEKREAAALLLASKSERLYSLAIEYLRRIADWANEHLPGVDIPTPPPELEADLY